MSAPTSNPCDPRPAVLLVDDDNAVRMVLQLVFQNHFRVFACEDGLRAINVVESNPRTIAVAVVDYSMAAMNGDRVCERLRELDASISLIGFTGNEEAIFRTPLFAHRIKKHVSNIELLALVHDAAEAASLVRRRETLLQRP